MGGTESDITQNVELSEKESHEAKRLADKLTHVLKNIDPSIAFAALADAGIALSNMKEEKNG